MVDHSRAGVGLLKDVLVAPVPERSSLHRVGERVGALVLNDLGGHPPPNTEMPSAPRHVITEVHAPMANSIDDALPRQRCEVDSDIEGHVEADGWIGGNVSAE